jgi:Icc-related predicted phosphoesterase
MLIVAISDTHNKHSSIVIPECDLLIHAGDATGRGTYSEVVDFAEWFEKQPAKHKVWVPGNHEKHFEKELPASMLWFTEHCSGHVLINQEVTIEGLRIYGSPVTPYFNNWAWNKYPDEIQEYWNAIPEGLDILITHGPAFDILDTVYPGCQPLGCPALRASISIKKPKIHISGHIHGGHGTLKHDATTHYNVSICNEAYQPINPISVI